MMTFVKEEQKDIKIFCHGQEKRYYGNKIQYREKTKLFIYYYFPDYRGMYILDDSKEESAVPYIEEKIRIIGKLEYSAVTKIREFMQYCASDDNKNRIFRDQR